MCKERNVPTIENKRVTLFSRLQMDAGSEEVIGSIPFTSRALWNNHKTAFGAGDIGQSTRALELCGKHFANFTDRVSTGPDVFNVEIIIPNRDPNGTD